MGALEEVGREVIKQEARRGKKDFEEVMAWGAFWKEYGKVCAEVSKLVETGKKEFEVKKYREALIGLGAVAVRMVEGGGSKTRGAASNARVLGLDGAKRKGARRREVSEERRREDE